MTIDFDKSGGLVPAIAQDADTGEVLMLAWMNAQAFEETLRTRRAVYFSRSRAKLWRKGEESGNVQEVREIFIDCDADTILLKVHQVGGAACHEGYPTCFFRRLEDGELKVVGERVFDPKQVYSAPKKGILKPWSKEATGELFRKAGYLQFGHGSRISSA